MSVLGEGAFFASISFIQQEKSGNNIMLDHITRAFKFTVSQKQELNKLKWYSSSWGYVKFPNVEVKEIKCQK